MDPAKVPAVGTDAHLPAVLPERLTPVSLRERFLHPPPWEPEVRREPRFTDRHPRHASVLVPLVMHERPTLILTRRTSHLPTHAGQVAFPGGKLDESDADAVAAALREAEEEVGLERRFVEVLGCMPEYVTGTAFIVTPVVGLVQPGARLVPNPHEVEEVFEVPVDFLMNPANHHRHVMAWEGQMREWFSMPYRDATVERFIWGATAGMLRNLYRFLMA